MLVALPAGIGLLLLAGPILATLFQHGDFTAADVDMAGLSLMAYAFGLPGFMLIKVLAPAFYSRKDPRTPVRIAVISLVTNFVFNLVIVIPMVRLGVPGPHAGLALATRRIGVRRKSMRILSDTSGSCWCPSPVYAERHGTSSTRPISRSCWRMPTYPGHPPRRATGR